MRKSEERALEAFPPHNGASEQWIQAHLKGICGDYIKGYEQAIKDVIEWAEYQKSFEQGYDTGEAERSYRFALVDLIDELKRHY